MGKRSVLLLLLLATAALAAPASQEQGVEGKVIEVRGDRVRIALAQGGAAREGHQVEIYTADAQLAGFWLVVEAGPGEVTAVKVEAVTAPQVGWKARVYDADAMAQAPAEPPPGEKTETTEPEQAEEDAPPFDPEKVFGPPPPGAFVSTKGYAHQRADGTWQDGFDNFRRWAASRGPSREKMVQEFKKWKAGPGAEPFLGLWVEKNDRVISQIYAMAPTGLIVTGVCPGAPAEKAGLRAGDIILKIDGEFANDPLLLSEAAGKLALEVERDSKTVEITLEAERYE